MKKYCLPLLFSIIAGLYAGSSYAASSHFEFSGLQPLAPNGVFSTFTAGTVEEGKTAASVTGEKAREPDFYRYSAHFAHGIVEDVELSLSVPYVAEWQKGPSGFEDTAIGLKHRFFSEGKYGPSIAYLLTASIVPGRDEFSTDGHLGAGLIMSKRVGPFSGHGNFIYLKPGDDDLRDEIRFSAGLDFSATHDFTLLAELYGERSYFSPEIDKLEVRLGSRLLTRENIFTTVGAGFDLRDSSPEYRVMVSVTFVFPKDKTAIKKVYEEGD